MHVNNNHNDDDDDDNDDNDDDATELSSACIKKTKIQIPTVWHDFTGVK